MKPKINSPDHRFGQDWEEKKKNIDQDKMKIMEISTHRRWSILSLRRQNAFILKFTPFWLLCTLPTSQTTGQIICLPIILLRYHDEIALALQIITVISARNTICSCFFFHRSSSYFVCVDQIKKESTTIRIKRARTWQWFTFRWVWIVSIDLPAWS